MNNFVKIVYSLSLVSIFLYDFENVNAQDTKPSPIRIVSDNSSIPLTQIVAEGGNLPQTIVEDRTHLSREHVTEKLNITLAAQVANSTQAKNETTHSVNIISDTPVKKNPEIESGVPRKNDNSHSVGKKGVSPTDDSVSTVTFNQMGSGTNTNVTVSVLVKPTATTKLPIPNKPSITEHDDEAFVQNEANRNRSQVPTPNIHSIDSLDRKSNRADYVVPIVAVILSVPLVAIIISVLYKRGTDWWQHRNYRRMDFLIEGMYNT